MRDFQSYTARLTRPALILFRKCLLHRGSVFVCAFCIVRYTILREGFVLSHTNCDSSQENTAVVVLFKKLLRLFFFPQLCNRR